MGTAFGLDSITVIDFEPSAEPPPDPSTTTGRLQRRSARRSRY